MKKENDVLKNEITGLEDKDKELHNNLFANVAELEAKDQNLQDGYNNNTELQNKNSELLTYITLQDEILNNTQTNLYNI